MIAGTVNKNNWYFSSSVILEIKRGVWTRKKKGKNPGWITTFSSFSALEALNSKYICSLIEVTKFLSPSLTKSVLLFTSAQNERYFANLSGKGMISLRKSRGPILELVFFKDALPRSKIAFVGHSAILIFCSLSIGTCIYVYQQSGTSTEQYNKSLDCNKSGSRRSLHKQINVLMSANYICILAKCLTVEMKCQSSNVQYYRLT